MERNRRFAVILCLSAAIVLLLAGAFALHAREAGYGRAPQSGVLPEEDLTSYDGAWYRERKDVETTLLMGVDKAAVDETITGHGSYEQADFLMLLVFDRKAERYTAIHINRDTMAEIQKLSDSGRNLGSFVGQLTLAHTYGGQPQVCCRNTANAVSKLFYGVKIDHYLSLAMDGIPVLNDLAGGVTLEVMEDLTSVDPSLVQGETVTLRGKQALLYVRKRDTSDDESNLRRMERQRQYLEALQRQLVSKANEEDGYALSTLLKLNDYMVSDCSIEQLSKIADTMLASGIQEYRTLEGEWTKGEKYVEYHADEEALQRMVMELFYEQVEEGS